ncbi:MAG: hypothetical protein ACSHWY_05020 [Octadecabacter sp.]
MKMRHRIFAAALVAAATPLAAGADTCPTNADLETGIRLTVKDGGFFIIFKTVDDDLTAHFPIEYDVLPEAPQIRMAHPIAAANDPATANVSIVYGNDINELDNLPELGIWSTELYLMQDDKTLNTGTFSASFNGLDEISVGECKYSIWRVLIEKDLSNLPPEEEEVFYAPQLGIVLGSVTVADDGTRRPFIFDRVTAE